MVNTWRKHLAHAVFAMTTALMGVILLGPRPAMAATVSFGTYMDQSFSSNVYASAGQGIIPSWWIHLPWSDQPAGWPTQPIFDETWQNKEYTADPAGAARTVQAGQSFQLYVPRLLEDACRASNYGTRGYWKVMMVIKNNATGNEAWRWVPGGSSNYWFDDPNNGLNAGAQYCSAGSNYSSYNYWFQLTAPNVSTTTRYTAEFFAEESQYENTAHTAISNDISEISVPITVVASAPPPPPPQNPTVSISANPTSLTVGNATTVTATAANMPSGDYIKIQGTDGQVGYGGTGARTASMSDTQYSPTTVSYTAYIYNGGGQRVATSGSVSVTWTAQSSGGGGTGGGGSGVSGGSSVTVSLSAYPTQLNAGQASTLTATASENVGNTPYWINIFDVTDGQLVDSCGAGSSCTTTFSESYATTQTFEADIGAYGAQPSSSDQATSNQQTVTWINNAPPPPPTITLNLTGNPTTLEVGQSTTLTATASQPFSNAELAGIVPLSGGLALNTTGGSEYPPANAGTSFVWDVSSNQPGSETFQLRWRETTADGGALLESNDVTITWTAAPTVTLSASPTSLLTGQATTLTATASENLGQTPWYLNIVDLTTGQVVDSCGNGTTCVTTFTENQATTQQFQADIGPRQAAPSAAGTQATSNIVPVTWTSPPSVTLSANPTSLRTGHATTLTATASNMPSGDAVEIVGTDGLQQTGSPGSTGETTHDTRNTPTTVTYTAYIVNNSGQHVATSNTQQVTWTAPPAAATECVPYRPGYELLNGIARYNPLACPVPTPVNF